MYVWESVRIFAPAATPKKHDGRNDMSADKKDKPYSEKKKQYNVEYTKAHYKRIPLDVTHDKYDEIKSASDHAGETVNGYIKKAVDMRLESGA